jgi:hypothetical protein
MFSFFKKEKWGLVQTITIDNINWGTTPGGHIFIHLYESDKGNRKSGIVCSFRDAPKEKVDAFVKGKELYQKKIHRWLSGRYDPQIPTYNQLAEEDTANALRGKVE